MTKAEQTRVTAWRFRVLRAAEDDRNVAKVCRRFGISRKSFYKWKRRHAEHGAAGLCDRPRTPHVSPRATARDVVSKILYLRQHYHFVAGRIAAYLKRFHQIAIAGSTVHRILTRHGMPRLPANQKHRPHGKRWQRNRSSFVRCASSARDRSFDRGGHRTSGRRDSGPRRVLKRLYSSGELFLAPERQRGHCCGTYRASVERGGVRECLCTSRARPCHRSARASRVFGRSARERRSRDP